MLAFIQSLPTPVESLLKHIDNPPFVELLVRIIQLDEYPGGSGVLEVRDPSVVLAIAQPNLSGYLRST